jgi:peptide/bleomycin uptake transporter
LIKSFFGSKEHAVFAWLVLGVLIALTVAQVYMTVQFNEWYKGFYNSLENKDFATFKSALVVFSGLATISILLSTFSVFIAQHYCFRWRQAITFAYLPFWQKADAEVEGGSQRLQEDTQKWASIVFKLGLGAFKASLTLLAFIPILWGISKDITFWGIQFEGFLVWVALASSLGAMGISALVGIKLPRLEYNNQRTEAAYRKTLVYAEDDRSKADTLTVQRQFQELKENYFALYRNFKWFGLWENTYEQVAVVVPYVAAAPAFFAGMLTLGGLVQVSNAFGKVHASFSFFVANWAQVAELRSVIIRLREFEKAIGYR